MAVRNVKSDFEMCKYDKNSVIDLYNGLFANSLNAYKGFFNKTYNETTLNFDIAKNMISSNTLNQFVNLWNTITQKMQLFLDIVKKEKFKTSLLGKLAGSFETVESNFRKLQSISVELDELDTQMWGLQGAILNELNKAMYKFN